MTTILILTATVLLAVIISWYVGRRAGTNEQELKDQLEHQETVYRVMLEQRKIDEEIEKYKARKVKEKPLPLTQENVDKMLEKYGRKPN